MVNWRRLRGGALLGRRRSGGCGRGAWAEWRRARGDWWRVLAARVTAGVGDGSVDVE